MVRWMRPLAGLPAVVRRSGRRVRVLDRLPVALCLAVVLCPVVLCPVVLCPVVLCLAVLCLAVPWLMGLLLVGVRCRALPGLRVIRVGVRRAPVWLVRGR
jgi:hypothetical protein